MSSKFYREDSNAIHSKFLGNANFAQLTVRCAPLIDGTIVHDNLMSFLGSRGEGTVLVYEYCCTTLRQGTAARLRSRMRHPRDRIAYGAGRQRADVSTQLPSHRLGSFTIE